MTRRMLDSRVWTNNRFGQMPVMARLLLLGVINLADDQGRLMAHPVYLRSQIFPYDDVAIADIGQWLQLFVGNGTIAIYQTDGKDYIQLLNWWDYQSLQYPAPSEYPALPDWQDRIRYNAKGGLVLTYNWVNVKGERLPDTCDSHGNPVRHSYGVPPTMPPATPPENPLGVPSEAPHESPSGTPPDAPLEAPIQLEDQEQYNTDQDNLTEEETHAGDPLLVAWQQAYKGIEMPPKLPASLLELVAECGMAATIHGIKASASKKDGRNFRYIAECARNYVPPAPVGSYTNGNGYHVELPGVHVLTPPANPQPPPALPPPMAHDDPWAVALAEMLPTLSTQAAAWLKDSTLSEESELAGEPFYQVLVTHPKADMQWLTQQLELNVRRRLRTLIGKRINLAFVHTPHAAQEAVAP